MIQIDIREYKENIKGDTLNLLTTHEICLPIASFFKLRKSQPQGMRLMVKHLGPGPPAGVVS